jgi:hypothetical protein
MTGTRVRCGIGQRRVLKTVVKIRRLTRFVNPLARAFFEFFEEGTPARTGAVCRCVVTPDAASSYGVERTAAPALNSVSEMAERINHVSR